MYVGSTTKKYLSQRLESHRNSFKCWKNGNNKYTTSFKVLENDNFKIVLLEPVNCNSNDELKARERVYIETLVCVNKCIPLRTRKEYYKDNKDLILEKSKEYNDTNQEYLKAYWKEYRKTNIEQITKSKKVKIACECGSIFTATNKSQHCKSLKHMKYCEGSS
tara:strand:- start:55 stop:543 length:489 start_codon:yes stop_codon:yes gene_type:complete